MKREPFDYRPVCVGLLVKKIIIPLLMIFKMSCVLPAGSPPSTVDRLLSERPAIRRESVTKTKAALESHYRGNLLHLFAMHGRANVVRELVRRRLDVDALDEGGQTALHWAARTGREECARILLEAGAGINSRNGYGNTPLHLAVLYGHEACVALLLQQGADYSIENIAGERPIILADRFRYRGIFMLLSMRADNDRLQKQ